MNRLRPKPTYSNVMVTVLAFVVLAGGTAYAATEMLPKNSVGSKQIVKGAVTPAKLSKAARATLIGAVGPQGPTGATGPAGPAGAEGKEGKEGREGKEGPRGLQGPGAISIEDSASGTFREVGTYDGIVLSDYCTSAGAELQFADQGTTSMTFFGTYQYESKILPLDYETSELSISWPVDDVDVTVKNQAAGPGLVHFDLHLPDATCKLVGMITPTT